jgi:hypothetical protein
MTIRRLADLLQKLELDPSEEDLLDVLWLAQYLRASADVSSAADAPGAPADRESPKVPAHAYSRRPEERSSASRPEGLDLPYSLYPRKATPENQVGQAHAAAVRAPAAAALGEQLSLAKALRPLARKVPSRHRQQLDEQATATRIAEEEIWIPAMKPAPARWLEIALVVDGYESMSIWRQAIAELHALLHSVGAFRDVRYWVLDQDSQDLTKIGVRRAAAGAALRSPKELVDPAGRRAVIVVSDCLGPLWQSRAAQRVLAYWARRGPVAIVQPLPQRLWSYSHASPDRVRLRALQPGTPNSHLDCRRASGGVRRQPAANSVPVPVLELEPTWIASWSRLLTAFGASGVDAMVIFASETETPAVAEQPVTDIERLTPGERVQRFKATASPDAFRLAGYLSASPVSLPVIRLVQEAMITAPRGSQVAEVFLGGLLYRLDDGEVADPDEAQYDFVPGVRELLQRRLRRQDALRTLRAVSRYVGERFGQARDFRALLSGADIEGEFVISTGSRPFAEVAEQVLRSLGGSYTQSAQRLAAALGRSSPGDLPAARGPEEAGQPSVGVVTRLADAPSVVAAASEAEFKAALAQVPVHELRSRQWPLACPYCYKCFAERDILFRCSGETAADGRRCALRPDRILETTMGESAKLPPVVEADGRRDEATCTKCGTPTRVQICPGCHSRLPASFRTVQSRLIALVGPSQAGKTAYMTVLIHELRHQAGELLMSSTIGADETTQERFSKFYEWPMYRQSRLPTPTQHQFISPLVFRFTTTRRGRLRPYTRELLLSFADSAGEDLVLLSNIELMARYLAAADAVIILIDPLQFQEVRNRIRPGTPVPDRARPDEEPIVAFDRITDLLSLGYGHDQISKPVAVVISKIDVLWQLLPEESSLHAEKPAQPSFDSADSALLQENVTAMLDIWGVSSLDQIVRTRYSNCRYFGVSALGVTPTADNRIPEPGIDPYRVTEPFMWLLDQFGILRSQ